MSGIKHVDCCESITGMEQMSGSIYHGSLENHTLQVEWGSLLVLHHLKSANLSAHVSSCTIINHKSLFGGDYVYDKRDWHEALLYSID